MDRKEEDVESGSTSFDFTKTVCAGTLAAYLLLTAIIRKIKIKIIII
ncbi:MAG: hypothetical protein J6I62_02230 [Selenomonadaceae bacterium]|nr:hypothetical protein [Selenomonadaceae bacterium]